MVYSPSTLCAMRAHVLSEAPLGLSCLSIIYSISIYLMDALLCCMARTPARISISSHKPEEFRDSCCPPINWNGSGFAHDSYAMYPAGLPDNISIPPPRPKRKPSHPYPKKPFSGSMSLGTEGGGSQDMPPPRLPDYSHLAPKMSGGDRLDVAVAAVAQAASAAAAAAAAAVISAAGEHIRAHMQVWTGLSALQCLLPRWHQLSDRLPLCY